MADTWLFSGGGEAGGCSAGAPEGVRPAGPPRPHHGLQVNSSVCHTTGLLTSISCYSIVAVCLCSVFRYVLKVCYSMSYLVLLLNHANNILYMTSLLLMACPKLKNSLNTWLKIVFKFLLLK